MWNLRKDEWKECKSAENFLLYIEEGIFVENGQNTLYLSRSWSSDNLSPFLVWNSNWMRIIQSMNAQSTIIEMASPGVQEPSQEYDGRIANKNSMRHMPCTFNMIQLLS